MQQEALALAERNGRPFTLAQAVMFSAYLLLLEEDWAEAGKLADRAAEPVRRIRIPALARDGARGPRPGRSSKRASEPAGSREIEEGLASRRSQTGLRLGNSLLLSFRAGACLRAARIDEGLAAADAGLTHCRETTERCFEAELWRLKGELVLRRAPPAAGHGRS